MEAPILLIWGLSPVVSKMEPIKLIHIVVQNYPLLIIKTISLHIRPEIFSNIKKVNHVETVAFRFI